MPRFILRKSRRPGGESRRERKQKSKSFPPVLGKALPAMQSPKAIKGQKTREKQYFTRESLVRGPYSATFYPIKMKRQFAVFGFLSFSCHFFDFIVFPIIFLSFSSTFLSFLRFLYHLLGCSDFLYHFDRVLS